MTAIESDIDALWLAFEQSHDLALLGMLSDEYLSQGDDLKAECLRWCAEKGRIPSVATENVDYKKLNHIYWWVSSDNKSSEIPQSLFVFMRDSCGYSPYEGTKTFRQAYEVLSLAWKLYPDTDKSEFWLWKP